ncbi:L-threonylcarbamoyladenylate synthase [Alkalihalobacillus sp. LMS39]|uniref:L-threonylcarbamoyladenylate synthase n=1 Tax=Alkalihalobacillus sp. LMS39 TaxID=2924032 RepID=UPI001FB5024E|nr:L-threonylcarbamoyladenylate synthase [Alkalihalobacillus sp. LMS39]UOE93956.1 threonylcarbamoyl-AMP synthase [Alkalihalobacillus sp. LMS39]
MSYKQTYQWVVDKNNENLRKTKEIKDAALLINQNEIIAFPTETVYGLGGNAKNDEAIKKIFAAKGRPSDNPLIVHVATIEQATQLVTNEPAYAKTLMKTFWPGPLTLVFTGGKDVSPYVTAGLGTIAIRIPDHPVALALLEEANLPVAAPSANQSGKPSPTAAKHVQTDLLGRISGIIDGGDTGVGVESTVVDCTGVYPMILRPGGVTKEQLEAVVGRVDVDESLSQHDVAPKSPGMKYTHYAPNADFILVENEDMIHELIQSQQQEGLRVGVLTTEEQKDKYKADVVIACGYRADVTTVAKQLYDSLRAFNEKNVDIIFSETFPKVGVGVAIMNRLEKAAGGIIIR